VTTTVIVLRPIASGIGGDAAPEAVGVPSTVIVAFASVAVAVTVVDDAEFDTNAV
jgi:hypothetical protein